MMKAMTNIFRRATGLLVAAFTILPASADAATLDFTIFDPPGSTATEPYSINAAGAITGSYYSGGVAHGFVRDPSGDITPFDPTGSTATEPQSINTAGAITGYYYDGLGIHGFLRDPDGVITPFDPPGSAATIPYSINTAGAITGYYVDAGVAHGFLRDPSGVITPFDPPGSQFTYPTSINTAGAITGYYEDAGGVSHGFVRDPGGAFTPFDPAGSGYTQAFSINTAGAITGYYQDAGGAFHGFLRDPSGVITPFDPPGSPETSPKSINTAGAITGFHYDAVNVTHGFLRDPGGAFTTVDPPGSINTQPRSINTAGAITGYYEDADGAYHGFLLLPPEVFADAPFQVRYASNLTHGDSIVNITNTGANGNSLFGPGFGEPAGNLCVNIYAFSPDEQLISCCSCPVTPNGLVNLTANRDLVSNTLTGIRPDSIVIKSVATATGKATTGEAEYTGATCSGSAAFAGDQFPVAPAGLLAWGTTLHSSSTVEPNPGPFSVSESQFLPATMSADELRSITSRCKNIIGNGSTFGICRSCRQGGLGGVKL